MRRELQLPIFSLQKADSYRVQENSKNGLSAWISRIWSRVQRLDSLDVSENSPLYSGSAYAGFVSRQRVGRAR